MKRPLPVRLPLTLLLGLTLLGTPVVSAAAQELSSEAQSGRRAAIVSIAERYATFRWKGSVENAFHGEDEDGVRVDTSDDSLDESGWRLDAGENEGMPYCWGGFTSIEQFHEGLEQGLYAGLVPVSERAFPSRFAMGLDCSGFVARCWNLPQKQSTRSLGALSYELASYDELLPGDILNKFDSHVVLFAGFANPERTRVRVIEAARIKVAEAVYETALLRSRGFVPMRYKPLDARWAPMEELEPVFEVVEGEERGRFIADGAEVAIEDIPNPVRGVRVGEWARYDKTESRLEGTPLTSTRMVARAAGGAVEVQAIHEQEGMQLMRGGERDITAPFCTALMDFAGFVEPFRDLDVAVATVESGSYELAGRSFPARRIHVIVEGNLLSRHKLFPAWTEIRCVQSDEVPLQGILEAEYHTEVTWNSGEDGEAAISQETKTFRLRGFGGDSGMDPEPRREQPAGQATVGVGGRSTADFERVLGGPAFDRGVHVTAMEDGRYVATGVTESSGKGGQDVWLVLWDAEGEVLWSRTHGGEGQDLGWSVLPTATGFLVAGFTNSSGAGGFDFYLVRTDAQGERVWSQTYGGTGEDRCWALAATKDGGFVLAGETDSSGAGERDFLLIKTDSAGKELWSRTYGGEKDDRCFAVAPADDGGYVLVGQTFSEGAGDRDAYVVKTGAEGELQWSRTFGGPLSDVGHSVCRTADGDFFVTGYTASFATVGEDPYLIKIGADGSTRWTRVLPLAGVNRTFTGEQASDGGYFCVGFSTGPMGGKGTALLLETDAEGRLERQRTFFPRPAGESMAYTVRATADGGCVFTGHATDAGNADLVLVKVGP